MMAFVLLALAYWARKTPIDDSFPQRIPRVRSSTPLPSMCMCMISCARCLGVHALVTTYAFSLLLYYALTPIFLARSSATLLSMSLLSSSLYTLFLTLMIFDHTFSAGYLCCFF